MAITVVGTAYGTTISYPATQPGDLLLVFADFGTSGTGTPVITGFTSAFYYSYACAYWRVCDGSESGSFNSTGGSFGRRWLAMLHLRGVDDVTPVRTSDIGIINSSSTTSYSGRAVITASARAVVVCACIRHGGPAGAQLSGWADGTLTGVAEIFDNGATTGGDNGGVAVAWGVKPAGTSGSGTMTATLATAAGWTGYTLVLNPAFTIDAVLVDPAETMTATAAVTIAGTATITDPVETLAATAVTLVPIEGVGTLIDPVETIDARIAVEIAGAGVLVDPDDTLSASAAVIVTGTGAMLDPVETIAAALTIEDPSISGIGHLVDPVETLAGTAVIEIAGAGVLLDPVETISATLVLAQIVAAIPNPGRVARLRAGPRSARVAPFAGSRASGRTAQLHP